MLLFFFSSRRRHTRSKRDWSSDVCSSDLTRFVILSALCPTGRGGLFVRICVRYIRLRTMIRHWELWKHSRRSEERRVGKEGRSGGGRGRGRRQDGGRGCGPRQSRRTWSHA